MYIVIFFKMILTRIRKSEAGRWEWKMLQISNYKLLSISNQPFTQLKRLITNRLNFFHIGAFRNHRRLLQQQS